MQKFAHAMKLKKYCVALVWFRFIAHAVPPQDFYRIQLPQPDVRSCSVRQSAILWRVCNIIERFHYNSKITVFEFEKMSLKVTLHGEVYFVSDTHLKQCLRSNMLESLL